MKIYGKFIGDVMGHKSSPALVDRVIELYQTKTLIKAVVFNSSTIGWHKKTNVITEVVAKHNNRSKEVIETLISRLVKEQEINYFSCSFETEENYGIYYHNRCYGNGDYGYYHRSAYINDTKYEGEQTENGICYKNLSAWEQNNGVIYISEYELEDYNNGDVKHEDLWTKESWTKWVRDFIYDNYKNETDVDKILADNKFIEMIAFDVLQNADWQDLSTLLNEYDYNGEWLYDNWEEWKHNHF